MKLHILSDLHSSVGSFEQPQTEADLVVLAGDIARPREAVAWANGCFVSDAEWLPVQPMHS